MESHVAKNEGSEEAIKENSQSNSERRMICCIVCEDEFPETEMHGCKDVDEISERHCMCSECFLGYANEEMAGGAFEGVRYFKGDSSSPLISRPGNLPCPHFITGKCETVSIPLTTLFRVFQQSNETAKLYYLASQRVMHQELEQERYEATIDGAPDSAGVESEADVDGNDVAIEAIRLRVQAALDRGAVVKCPQCRQPGIKNSHCIHIRCHLCANSWCYCCGRTRESNAPDAIRCRGCDSIDSRLEHQPEWGNFAIGSETPAYGALHEFHRRRQAYFVRDVKMTVVPYLWEAFRQKHPTILKNVPTTRRRIRWEELDSPIAPPVFGNSTEGDLLWALRPRDTEMPDPDEQDDPDQESQDGGFEPEPAPPTVVTPWSQVFSSRAGVEWLCVLAAIVSMTVVGTYFSLFRSSIGFTICFLALCAIMFYYTTIFLLLRIADYFELHPHSLWARLIPDVIFVGRRGLMDDGEGPYFSASGRWRHQRRGNFVVPMGFLACGGLLLSISLVLNIPSIGGVGLMFVAPVVTVVCLYFLILNMRPLPPIEGHGLTPPAFTAIMGLLRSYQLFSSPGILFVYQNPYNPFGIFLIMFSLSLSFAEIMPRFFADNFLTHYHTRMRRSYFFWFGVMVLLYCLWFYFVFTESTEIAAVIVGALITAIFWRSAAIMGHEDVNQNQPAENDVEMGNNEVEIVADDEESVTSDAAYVFDGR